MRAEAAPAPAGETLFRSMSHIMETRLASEYLKLRKLKTMSLSSRG